MKNLNELTVAYLAIGAIKEIDRINENNMGCELEVINDVVGQARFLDEFWEEHQAVFSEVCFEYDVIEPFAAEFVISDGEKSNEEILKHVLKGALTEEAFISIYKKN